MPASFTAKFNFGYGWFLGEDPGTEPMDYITKALDALVVDCFAQDIVNTAGLVYACRGGMIYDRASRLPVRIPARTIALPANRICYVERSEAGLLSFNTDGWTLGLAPLALVTTNNFEIITVIDSRVVNSSFPNLTTSVFGRIGDIVATSGDYTANLIRLLTTVAHYPMANNVQDVLDLMTSDIHLALNQGVTSFGPNGGPYRIGAVVTQYGDYHAYTIRADNNIPNISLLGVTNPSVQHALQRLGAISGVSSFNTRIGAIAPIAGDYPATLIPYSDEAERAIFLPSGVSFGSTVQTAVDALKVHYHDATQILMNPALILGCNTVQETMQWLYDNRGSVTNLAIVTGSQTITGTAPFALSLTLNATGGSGAYTWTKVSTTLPGTVTLVGSLLSGAVATAGTYEVVVRVEDGITSATKTITLLLTTGTGSLVWGPGTLDAITLPVTI